MKYNRDQIVRKMIVQLHNLQDSEQAVDIDKLRKVYKVLSEMEESNATK